MCKLFGFRSVINSQVHSSLVHADNALGPMSLEHPDGWGVAYYIDGTPHLLRSTERAFDDQIFHKVSGVVSSQTVLAHIRKATNGNINILNSHPFQYGNWVFAHNGNLKNFSSYQEQLKKEVDGSLQKFILGNTDSEIIFYILLGNIKKKHSLKNRFVPIETLSQAIEETCKTIIKYSGPLYSGDDNNPKENHITFILTSGENIFAFNGGQSLNFSTHKSTCPERESCSHYSKICESFANLGDRVNHLLFASEKLNGENVWTSINKGQLIGVDKDMVLKKIDLNVSFT